MKLSGNEGQYFLYGSHSLTVLLYVLTMFEYTKIGHNAKKCDKTSQIRLFGKASTCCFLYGVFL